MTSKLDISFDQHTDNFHSTQSFPMGGFSIESPRDRFDQLEETLL